MKSNSYVLIFSLVILSMAAILTNQLLRTTYVGLHFDRTMIDREKAEMLALGGINIAIAQLTYDHESESTEKPNQESSDKKKNKHTFTKFLERVLPNLNRWQEFALKEDIDGMDGNVKICISCENGKININQAFDFQKQEFKPEYKEFLSRLQMQGVDKEPGQILKQLTEFLKKRNKKIDDISEIQANGLPSIKQLFYEPPMPHKKIKEATPNISLAIQDIFTIWTESDKLEALFLSDSLCAMLGLRRPVAHDAELMHESFKEAIKNFKKDQDENTENYWQQLKHIYAPKNELKLHEKKIFSSTFEANTFSVLSSGKVGSVEQTVLAIIQQTSLQTTTSNDAAASLPQESTQPQKHMKKDDQTTAQPPFKIIRLYWI